MEHRRPPFRIFNKEDKEGIAKFRQERFDRSFKNAEAAMDCFLDTLLSGDTTSEQSKLILNNVKKEE